MEGIGLENVDMRLLSQRFLRFAQDECGHSPLYRRLAEGIAGDPDLLALAAHTPPGQPRPNLLLAAVHYLLLQGTAHPLAACYPSLGGSLSEGADPFPLFQDFCRRHHEAIRAILSSRRVQTNEVARAAYLLPAFQRIAGGHPGRPLALVEVGTSAGLLLLWDQYAYDYGTGRLYGDPASPVRLHCALTGPVRPPLPDLLPQVAARAGIDIHPVDMHQPDEAAWLKALVWADQPDRVHRLEAAIAVARRHRLSLVQGDALEVLPDLVAGLPGDGILCIFHLHTLNQFDPAARERFQGLLQALSTVRELYQLSVEVAPGRPQPDMELRYYAGGALAEHRLLARCHGHGAWMEWVDPTPPEDSAAAGPKTRPRPGA
jgi:hypothetical protein